MTTIDMTRPEVQAPPPHPATRSWERPALGVLLAATALLYLWDLGSSGYANTFYSAAAQAGSESWKAFFFGASDAAASITVDKTPASLWVMGLSVRVFGLSSWSILVPEALMGVASVGLLHSTVRRATGSAPAGLIAGLVLATTPVAALMFRFDNPDALLVLLLIGSVYGTLRALEGQAARKWLFLAGALVGFAFLTKMLQAFLVLPPLALVYAIEARVGWGRKIADLLVAFAGVLLSAGWWIAIVSLWPAASRPYIGGSQNNSILELTLGYNGFGRLTGNETGSVGGGGAPGGNSMWGQTGLFRMFSSEIGGQVAWLIPAALILLGVGLWLTRRTPGLTRASLIVWGGWLLVTALTFSFMAGIFHAYYTVALAPAIGALVGTGAVLLWERRDQYVASLALAAVVSCTSAFAFVMLGRTPDYLPWLKWLIALLGFGSALLLAFLPYLGRGVGQAVAVTALVAALLAPTAYSISTAASPHGGSIPTAGPASTQGPGGMRGPGGGAGGLLNGSTSSTAMTALLKSDASSYTWVAATVGANSAAGYQLATGLSVMPIGGFNGTDPSPTLAQFQQYVAQGKIHYFIAGGGGMGGPGGSQQSSEISTWVEQSFAATTVDGVTVYDLTAGA
jgi:4-amino-4-deoxy-L-arabinose transferase-like glycosyltransferase